MLDITRLVSASRKKTVLSSPKSTLSSVPISKPVPSSQNGSENIVKLKQNSMQQNFPGTAIPLSVVLPMFGYVLVFCVLGEMLYENSNSLDSNKIYNISKVEGIPIPHNFQFQPEFLIPTNSFPDFFHFEKIVEKSNLPATAVYQDFLFVQSTCHKVFIIVSQYISNFFALLIVYPLLSTNFNALTHSFNKKHPFICISVYIFLNLYFVSKLGNFIKKIMYYIMKIILYIIKSIFYYMIFIRNFIQNKFIKPQNTKLSIIPVNNENWTNT